MDDVIELGMWSVENFPHKLHVKSCRGRTVALKKQINLLTKVFGVKAESKRTISVCNV